MKFILDLNMSLNINNYTVDDFTYLFKIPKKYNNEHLLHCKKIVVGIHPDKSKIDPKFFIFFYKAYNILCEEKKNQTRGTVISTNNFMYDPKELDKDNEYNIKNINPTNNGKNIWDNAKFRDTFNLLDNSSVIQELGYGDWLKDETNDCTTQFPNKPQQALTLNDRSINISSICGTDLIDTGNKSFGSDIFSSFEYSDIMQAYTTNPCAQYENNNEVNRYINSQRQPLNYNPNSIYN
jgi:hypothetical protein